MDNKIKKVFSIIIILLILITSFCYQPVNATNTCNHSVDESVLVHQDDKGLVYKCKDCNTYIRIKTTDKQKASQMLFNYEI